MINLTIIYFIQVRVAEGERGGDYTGNEVDNQITLSHTCIYDLMVVFRKGEVTGKGEGGGG